MHGGILARTEQGAFGKGGNGFHGRSGKHVQDVQIMAAFFEDERSGEMVEPPPVPRIVARQRGIQILGGGDREHLADPALIDEGFDLSVKGRVAQDKADQNSGFGITLCLVPYPGRIRQASDSGLFDQGDQFLLQRRQDAFGMEVVGARDDHGIEFAAHGLQQGRAILEITAIFRDRVVFPVDRAGDRIRVGQCRQSPVPRPVFAQIEEIRVGPKAAPDNADFFYFFHFQFF